MRLPLPAPVMQHLQLLPWATLTSIALMLGQLPCVRNLGVRKEGCLAGAPVCTFLSAGGVRLQQPLAGHEAGVREGARARALTCRRAGSAAACGP